MNKTVLEGARQDFLSVNDQGMDEAYDRYAKQIRHITHGAEFLRQIVHEVADLVRDAVLADPSIQFGDTLTEKVLAGMQEDYIDTDDLLEWLSQCKPLSINAFEEKLMSERLRKDCFEPLLLETYYETRQSIAREFMAGFERVYEYGVTDREALEEKRKALKTVARAEHLTEFQE